MEKKTIFLELNAEIIDKIDRNNVIGDRSAFISDLLEKQLQNNMTSMGVSTDLISRMEQTGTPLGLNSEISLMSGKGLSLGRFDVNTIEGFEELTKKISQISNDPIVKMRAERLL